MCTAELSKQAAQLLNCPDSHNFATSSRLTGNFFSCWLLGGGIIRKPIGRQKFLRSIYKRESLISGAQARVAMEVEVVITVQIALF